MSTNIPSGSNLYSAGFGTTSSNSFSGSAIRSTRAPSSTDVRGPQGNFPIGQVWIDTATPAAYILGSFTTSSGVVTANWLLSALNSGDLETLSGNTGTATPTASNIAIVGTGPVSTSASGSTITISSGSGGSPIEEINGDTGGAVTPTAGAVSIQGTVNQLVTNGAASTLTVSIDTQLQSTPITVFDNPRRITAIGIGAGANPIASDTTAVGFSALLNNTAAQSTAVGSLALSSNIGAGGSTAVGFSALRDATGGNNTAVGNLCATQTTTGTSNTAVGEAALNSNLIGDNNVAIGRAALQNAVASENTAVGANALTLNVGAAGNTAVGFNAGADITSGGSNTYVGHSAGSSNTLGVSNTGIGNAALASAEVNHLTAVGDSALTACTSGVDNSAFGSATLSSLTTGARNSAFGRDSLSASVSGNDNTCLGYQAGNALTTNDSNNILIGSGVTGTVGDNNKTIIGNGTSAKTYIRAIRGVTTDIADAINVLIDSGNQLGTASSSLRYKENIKPIDKSERIYDLKPVIFKYKSQQSDRPQYGLIAEEVYKVIPEIVVKDSEGKIDTIQYQTLPIFLLAEIQKLKKEIEALKAGK